MSSKVPKFQFENDPPAKPAKVANLYPTEAPQATPEVRPVTCESCPWYELNPWTHYPTFGAWCHRQMEHLVVGSAACGEFRRGEVPPRQPHKQVPAVPAATERILTCFECPRHEHDTVNPPEGWGRCALNKRGCYGLRPACSEIPRDTWDG